MIIDDASSLHATVTWVFLLLCLLSSVVSLSSQTRGRTHVWLRFIANLLWMPWRNGDDPTCSKREVESITCVCASISFLASYFSLSLSLSFSLSVCLLQGWISFQVSCEPHKWVKNPVKAGQRAKRKAKARQILIWASFSVSCSFTLLGSSFLSFFILFSIHRTPCKISSSTLDQQWQSQTTLERKEKTEETHFAIFEWRARQNKKTKRHTLENDLNDDCRQDRLLCWTDWWATSHRWSAWTDTKRRERKEGREGTRNNKKKNYYLISQHTR